MDRTQDRLLIAGLQSGRSGCGQAAGRTLRSPNPPARIASHEESGGCRRSHAGRAAEGVPEDRRVSRRRGALIVDLPHHVQHRDVAACASIAARDWPSRSAIARSPRSKRPRKRHLDPRPSPQTGRRCRMRNCCGSQLREAVDVGGAGTAGDLPAAGRSCAIIEGLTTEEASTPVEGEGSDAQVAPASRPVDAARSVCGLSRRV